MKRLAAALVILIIVLAGGWFILQDVAEHRLRSAIAQFREQLGPEAHFTYATATAAPLRMGADFTDAALTRSGIVLHASHVALAHVRKDAVGQALLRNVQIAGSGFSLHAAAIDVRGLPLAGKAAASAARSQAAGSFRVRSIEAHLLAIPGATALIASLSFTQRLDGHGGVSQSFTARRIVLLDRNAPVASVAVAHGHGAWPGAKGATGPIDTAASLEGLAIPQRSPLGRVLGEFGYDGAHGSMRITGSLDAAARAEALGPVTLTLDHVGQLSLSLGLDHLPTVSEVGGGSENAQQMLRQSTLVRLTGLSLIYDDAGLAGRVLSVAAARAGVTPTQFRSLITAELEARGQPDANGPRTALLSQFVRFINDPRRFSVTVRPPVPLPLAAFAFIRQMPPDQAAATAGLRLKAD